MDNQLAILKGIHPGFFLDREFKKRNIRKTRFAISLQEFPQTLVSITKGKRKMNTSLALKIEKALGLEEGYLMILQVYYDIGEQRKKNKTKPDLSQLRKALFWDTDIDKIDWEKQMNAVIKRVYSRGNELEKNEIQHFYGDDAFSQVIRSKEA
jgi:plasmid maintenance system antidote protein VapI